MSRYCLPVAIIVLALAACATDDDASGGRLEAGAGATIPERSKLMVIWGVSATSPDYMYKHGEVALSGAELSLDLSQDPPAEALNGGHLGVGHIALFKEDFELADGKFSDDDLVENNWIGLAEQHVLIYRTAELPAQPFRDWIHDFAPGLSCGKVAAKEGSFVSFAPADCGQIVITVAEDLRVPNWT